MHTNKPIPCSIGILTYNSEATLRRCLESVKGFGQIVIADGGSTDSTLDIAREYDCTIIQQSTLGTVIEDFSLERNRTLDAATYEWFFYLDSDEIMSEGLRDEIAEIASQQEPEYLVYRVPYFLVRENTTIPYRQFKVYYQTRLFNKESGARFIKKMHEKIRFDASVAVGEVTHPWYVPLDTQLDFSVYRRKVQYRIGVMVDGRDSLPFATYLRIGIIEPLTNALKTVIKVVAVRLRHPWREIIPLRYELYRMYSQWYMMRRMTGRYLLLRKKR